MTEEVNTYGGSPYQVYKSPNSHIKMPKISIPAFKVGDRVQERSKVRQDRAFGDKFKKSKVYRSFLGKVRKGIVLEVCPGSNVFLGVYPTLSSHPIKRLRDQGVKVTISTDDPPFFRTTMNAEYESLSRTFGWTESDFLYLNRVALDAAFCDEATKDKLLRSSKL